MVDRMRSRFVQATAPVRLTSGDHQTFCRFVNRLTSLFADLPDCLSLVASNETAMKLSSLLAIAGTMPLPAELSRTGWHKAFALLFHALHESRRRQAARELARHQHLLERHGNHGQKTASGDR
jgi:hypothetical protein